MNRLFFKMLALALIPGLWGCESYLEEDLIADVSASSYFTTESGLEDAVRGIYPTLKQFWGQEMGGTMTVFGTDAFTNGADGSHKGFNFYDSRLNPDASYPRNLWRDMYRGINQANAVLDRSEGIDMDPDRKAQLQAEARFLRAFFYFTLVRQYGDVHLTLEETEGIEIESNRTSAAAIYSEAIIPDLEEAFNILPMPEDQSDYGRPHKAACEFLLGKVYITRAYQPYGNGNADFQQAATYMENVMNNYNYSLVTPWGDLWALDNEDNSEVIWAISNTTNLIINGNGNRFHLYFLMEYDKLQGMQRDIANGRPWKRFRPTNWLLDLWDRSMDRRYDEGFKHVWFANNAGSIPTDDAGNPLYGIGDTSVFIPGPGRDFTEAEKAAVPYVVFNRADYTERVYPTLNKFIDPTRDNRQRTQGSRDWVPMRLADAILIAAEAYLGQGDVQKATDYVNMIRERAAWSGMEDQMRVSASDVDLDFILDERARELSGEMHRWYDLTRTGKLIERVRAHNPEGAQFIQDYHVLRPIPRDQIDKTTSDYPQNAGYQE